MTNAELAKQLHALARAIGLAAAIALATAECARAIAEAIKRDSAMTAPTQRPE